MQSEPTELAIWLQAVATGDVPARNQLLDHYRGRLKELVAFRLEPRLAPRVDPSDIVQETLIKADNQLNRYLEEPKVPFYVWMRQLALEQLVDTYRMHIRAQKRSIKCEQRLSPNVSDPSLMRLAERLAGSVSSPSVHLQREEMNQKMKNALASLREPDREVLVMRHLEQLSVREIAAVLGVSEGAVKVRHVRALERLRGILGEDFLERGQP